MENPVGKPPPGISRGGRPLPNGTPRGGRPRGGMRRGRGRGRGTPVPSRGGDTPPPVARRVMRPIPRGGAKAGHSPVIPKRPVRGSPGAGGRNMGAPPTVTRTAATLGGSTQPKVVGEEASPISSSPRQMTDPGPVAAQVGPSAGSSPIAGSSLIAGSSPITGSSPGASSPMLPPSRPTRGHDIFEEPENESNIDYLASVSDRTLPAAVKGATLVKLVQRLTHETHSDAAFLETFLLTYRSFTEPMQLLALLKSRFETPVPAALSDVEYEQYVKQKQNPIRLRVINVFRTWLKKYALDFVDDDEFVENFLQFLDTVVSNSQLSSSAATLRNLVEKARLKAREGEKTQDLVFSITPPDPLVNPARSTAIRMLDIPAQEMARQITLIESEQYRAIKPYECLNLNWSKNKEKAPNIMAMIQWSNHISNVVVKSIVKVSELKERIVMMKYWIDVADFCRQLNNFNGVMEICAGFENSSVHRLKQSWSGAGSKYNKLYEELHALMSRDHNFRVFRDYLHQVANPPCIPYLGVYLTDLTFVEEGNPDFLSGSELINFEKRRKVHVVIRDIRQYQQQPYCLIPVPVVQHLVRNITTLSESEAYALSKQVEDGSTPAAKPVVGKANLGILTRSRSQTAARLAISKTALINRHQLEPEFGEIDCPTLESDPFSFMDCDKNILLDSNGKIKSATLPKILERITHHRTADNPLMAEFLNVYRAFSDAQGVLDLLDKRFFSPGPVDASRKDEFLKKFLMPVRVRVVNTLKNWVDRYAVDFRVETKAQEKLRQCLQRMSSDDAMMRRTVDGIVQTLDKRLAELEEHSSPACTTLVVPHRPKPPSPVSLSNVSGEELGRCLTTKLDRIYATLTAGSFMQHFKGKPAQSILAYMALHNDIRCWAGSMLMTWADVNERTTALTQLLGIASACQELYNYDVALTIADALQVLLKRLPNAKSLMSNVPPSLVKLFDSLKGLLKGGMSRLNRLLDPMEVENENRPVLPPVFVYMAKAQELYDGGTITQVNDSIYPMINMKKLRNVVAVVSNILRFQKSRYASDSWQMDNAEDHFSSAMFEVSWERIEALAKTNSSLQQQQEEDLALEEDADSLGKLIMASSSSSSSVAAVASSSGGSLYDDEEKSSSSPPSASSTTTSSTSFVSTSSSSSSSSSPSSSSSLVSSEQLQSTLAELLRSDDELLGMLQEKLHRTAYLRQVENTLKTQLTENLALLGTFTGATPIEESNRVKSEITRRRFPSAVIHEVTLEDPEGFVSGWPSTYHCQTVAQPSGVDCLVAVEAYVDVDVLSSLLRLTQLFHRAYPTNEHRLVLVTNSLGQKALDVIQEKNIQVLPI